MTKNYNLFQVLENGEKELVIAHASIEKVIAYIKLQQAENSLVPVEETSSVLPTPEADVVRYQAFDAEPAVDVRLVKQEATA